MRVAVSVVIPVFNAEKYLAECLSSIIKQTLPEIEIIVINDGSTDSSKKIIVEFVERDSRIIFVDQSNAGVSAARNVGIQKASGEYIGFVDADDIISREMYKTMYEAAIKDEAELLVANVKEIGNSARDRLRLEIEDRIFINADRGSVVLEFLKFRYDYANWNKIYKRSVIKQFKIRFNEQLKIWEDLLFNLMFIAHSERIVSLKEPLYYYRIHENSVIASNTTLLSAQYNIFYHSYLSYCDRESFFEEKHVFIQERGVTSVSNIFTLIRLRNGSSKSFFFFFNQFDKEIRNLNRNIYEKYIFDRHSDSHFYWILGCRFFLLFSFFYTTEYFLKLKYSRFRQSLFTR